MCEGLLSRRKREKRKERGTELVFVIQGIFLGKTVVSLLVSSLLLSLLGVPFFNFRSFFSLNWLHWQDDTLSWLLLHFLLSLQRWRREEGAGEVKKKQLQLPLFNRYTYGKTDLSSHRSDTWEKRVLDQTYSVTSQTLLRLCMKMEFWVLFMMHLYLFSFKRIQLGHFPVECNSQQVYETEEAPHEL